MTRWTPEQYSEYISRGRPSERPPVKKAKFKNIRCQAHDGKRFASRLERDYYEQLFLRWKAGEVLWFSRQVSFDLEGGVVYKLDFLVMTTSGLEFIDTKGHQTQDSKNKLKQMKARYGIDVQLVRKV